MNDAASTTRATPQHPAGKRMQSRLARALRGITIAAAVACLCYLGYGMGRLWAEWRRASQPIETHLAAATRLASPALVLPLGGHWSFAELDWNLRSNAIAKNDVAVRFDELAALAAPSDVDSLPDVSLELVRLATGLKITPVERNGNHIYRLDQPQLKAQFIVRPTLGRLKAVSLAAAYPQNGAEWQMLDFTPQRSAAAATSAGSFLLPVPAGSERCGGRFTDDGRALLELIAVNSNADELLSMWNNAGWECRPSGLGNPTQFSYLCVHNDEVIYAWSADPPAAMHNLMLVRTPTSEHTTP